MLSQACIIPSVQGGVAWWGGHVWQGGRAWQERRPLQRTVSILLECILVTYTFTLMVTN